MVCIAILKPTKRPVSRVEVSFCLLSLHITHTLHSGCWLAECLRWRIMMFSCKLCYAISARLFLAQMTTEYSEKKIALNRTRFSKYHIRQEVTLCLSRCLCFKFSVQNRDIDVYQVNVIRLMKL